MKCAYRIVVLIIAAASLLSACNKSEKSTSGTSKEVLTNSIIGNWELRVVYGGNMPNPNPTYPPGNGDIWKFVDAHYYERYQGTTVTNSGSYQLTNDTCPETGRYMEAFVIDNYGPLKIYFEFSKDTLIMYHGVVAADGVIARYVRLAN